MQFGLTKTYRPRCIELGCVGFLAAAAADPGARPSEVEDLVVGGNGRIRSPRITVCAWITHLPASTMCLAPMTWALREILLPVSVSMYSPLALPADLCFDDMVWWTGFSEWKGL